jgi:YD repeat-containing protein
MKIKNDKGKMKKFISVLLVLCMVLALTACGGGTPDAPKTKTVYLVETITYEYKDESMDNMSIKYEYDETGKIVKDIQTIGEEEAVQVYHYDENGNLVSLVMTMGDMTTTSVQTYDENGNVLTQTMYDGELQTYSMKYTYDSQNRMLENTSIFDDVQTVTTYTYGEHNRPITMTVSKNGTVTQVITYTQNEEGRYTAAVTTDADGNVVARTEFVYDDNTQTQRELNADGEVEQTIIRTYDENGIVMKEEVSSLYSSYTVTYTYITMELPV